MSRTVMTDRVGKRLGEASPDTHRQVGHKVEKYKNLKIIRSVQMTGDFPEDASVTFDFAANSRLKEYTKKDIFVHVILDGRLCGLWNLQAIDDRVPKGLDGFTSFAEELGLKGAQLANIISGLKPPCC